MLLPCIVVISPEHFANIINQSSTFLWEILTMGTHDGPALERLYPNVRLQPPNNAQICCTGVHKKSPIDKICPTPMDRPHHNSSNISELSSENSVYRGIHQSLPWAAAEDLRIHRIHIFITQEEMNKLSKYKLIYSSLSLNNRSPCADGHGCLIFCHFP
jgi:hypothetical protein